MGLTTYAAKKAVRDEQYNYRRATSDGYGANPLYLLFFPALILYALVLLVALAVRGIYRGIAGANVTSRDVNWSTPRWLRRIVFWLGVVVWLATVAAMIAEAWNPPEVYGLDEWAYSCALAVVAPGVFFYVKARRWARS